MSDRLGTAQWEEQALVSKRYPFEQGKFWLGRTVEDGTPIGYRDDRHICLVSGTRGGKGTSVIINNLCFWPGSAVVVDPKGENATVTAARRGGTRSAYAFPLADGSGTGRYRANAHWTDFGDGTDYPPMDDSPEHVYGMGQAVHVLDPFKAAQVDERYRSSFNPLDVLDPNRDESIDEAGRIANAIVVVKDDAREPFWDESARTMLRGLILYVLTAPHFSNDERNLITVRNLILRGEWQIAEAIRAQGHDEEKIDPPHLLLWRNMERSQAFDGLVSGIGRRFRDMMKSADKTFEGVLQAVSLHTEFLDSPGMKKVLAKSNFKLSELKTRPEGMTLYLSLPQRYMDTHYRWLRMMVALTTTEMEITRGQPATGYPVLMVLDEFAGLKRMTAIETAVAQLAGFGVKLFFVLQSLEQLKHTYKDNWETFLSNSGVKVFFSIEDHFTREYVSKLVGETEVIRELRSANESRSQNRSQGESYSEGSSESRGYSQSTTAGNSTSQSSGTSESAGWSRGSSYGVSQQKWENWLWGTQSGIPTVSQGYNSSTSGSRGTSYSDTYGRSSSQTSGTSESVSDNQSYSRSSSVGSSTSAGTGTSETLHRRPLIQPDEVGRAFARIDDRNNPGYPGLALVLVTGANPFVVWRSNYFEDALFMDTFSAHPDHKPLPTTTYTVDSASLRPLLAKLEELHREWVQFTQQRGQKIQYSRDQSEDDLSNIKINEWKIKPGQWVNSGQNAAGLTSGHWIDIHVPYVGKVIQTAETDQNKTPSGRYRIPDGALFTVKHYAHYKQPGGVDPFARVRQQIEEQTKFQLEEKNKKTGFAAYLDSGEAGEDMRDLGRAAVRKVGETATVIFWSVVAMFLLVGLLLLWDKIMGH